MLNERKDLYIGLPAGLDCQQVYKELENNGTIDQIRKSVLEKFRTEANVPEKDGFITAEQHITNEINKTITTNRLTEKVIAGSGSSSASGDILFAMNRRIQNFIYGSTTHKAKLRTTLDLCFGEIDKFVYASPLVRDQLIEGVHSAMNTLYAQIQKREEEKEEAQKQSSPSSITQLLPPTTPQQEGGGRENKPKERTIVHVCKKCNIRTTPLAPARCNGKTGAGTFKCPKCKQALDSTQVTKKYLVKVKKQPTQQQQCQQQQSKQDEKRAQEPSLPLPPPPPPPTITIPLSDTENEATQRLGGALSDNKETDPSALSELGSREGSSSTGLSTSSIIRDSGSSSSISVTFARTNNSNNDDDDDECDIIEPDAKKTKIKNEW